MASKKTHPTNKSKQSNHKRMYDIILEHKEIANVDLCIDRRAERTSNGLIKYEVTDRDDESDVEYYEAKCFTDVCAKCIANYQLSFATILDQKVYLKIEVLRDMGASTWKFMRTKSIQNYSVAQVLLVYILLFGENGYVERPHAIRLYQNPRFKTITPYNTVTYTHVRDEESKSSIEKS